MDRSCTGSGGATIHPAYLCRRRGRYCSSTSLHIEPRLLLLAALSMPVLMRGMLGAAGGA